MPVCFVQFYSKNINITFIETPFIFTECFVHIYIYIKRRNVCQYVRPRGDEHNHRWGGDEQILYMACIISYGMFSDYMACFQFIWHVFRLYGMFSGYMACFQFIWHVFILYGIFSSLYGMFSVYMACFQLIWHVLSLYGMFSICMASF